MPQPGTLYIRPDRSPVAWAEPTPVAASQPLVEMIGYLGSDALGDAARARAEAVLADLLQPVAMTTIDLRLPDDDRARQVALALLDHPADKRTLPDRGRDVGASARTLARGFLGRHRDTVRPVAHAAAAPGGAARARGRAAGIHGRPAGRLRHGQRACRGVPAGDRVYSRRVLRVRRGQPVSRCHRNSSTSAHLSARCSLSAAAP
jgi:CubicO group peptidase (beta-lactamase class C family)